MLRAGVLALASLHATAQLQLTCAIDSLGRSWCVQTGAVRETSGGLRLAPLYQGNDRVAYPAGYMARASCQDEVLEFLAAGRPFWRAHFNDSAITMTLGSAMCF
jgi:hypothetical protein